MANIPEIDAALRKSGFHRLEPHARLPARQAIDAAARAAGFALPDDYAYFCATYGAGAFDEPAYIALPAGAALGPDFRVDTLYAVGANEDWDPIALASDTYLDRLPQGLLPIGTDPGGNLLLLGTAKRAGVYAWDHEHRELGDGELDRRVADLERARVDAGKLDIDQTLLLWEQMFAARVGNPTGHGNLYRVAPSFAGTLAALRGA